MAREFPRRRWRRIHRGFIRDSQCGGHAGGMKAAKRGIVTRRNFLRLMAAGAAGAIADAFWIEPGWLTVTRCDVPCRNLPAGLDGLRVGLLADMHFQPEHNEALMEEAISRVNAEKLD